MRFGVAGVQARHRDTPASIEPRRRPRNTSGRPGRSASASGLVEATGRCPRRCGGAAASSAGRPAVAPGVDVRRARPSASGSASARWRSPRHRSRRGRCSSTNARGRPNGKSKAPSQGTGRAQPGGEGVERRHALGSRRACSTSPPCSRAERQRDGLAPRRVASEIDAGEKHGRRRLWRVLRQAPGRDGAGSRTRAARRYSLSTYSHRKKHSQP